MEKGKDKMAKILVIDDESVLCEIFSLILQRQGFGVVSAENGKKGLDVLVAEKPDLIVCDYDMPVMNGSEFCKNLKENPQYADFKDTKVIGMSGAGSWKGMENYLAGKPLEKPLSSDTLINEVKQCIA